jgi:hypothetical protein
MTKQHPFKVWFVIGILLDVYGSMILGAGIYNYFCPPSQRVVMEQLHAAIWWGALLLLMGVFYTIRFMPKKSKN